MTSRGERSFLIREYQMIKNNAKVESIDGSGLMTIKVNCEFPIGSQTRERMWDRLLDRYPRTFAFENKVEIQLDYAYELGFPFTPP